MNWRTRFLILAVVAVPAFTGYPVNQLNVPLIPGITQGWLGYFLTASTTILLVLGPRHFSNTVSIAALITLPVVFVGGSVSYLMLLAGFGHGGGQAGFSVHYVALCLTMLTVIPLALSLVAVIPFHEIEENLLAGEKGVSKSEKCLLMFLRVFNHIVYSVIPNIVDVMREEDRFHIGANIAGDRRRSGQVQPGFRALIRTMVRIGVEGICAAVQFIPLWAVEISQLPDKKGK